MSIDTASTQLDLSDDQYRWSDRFTELLRSADGRTMTRIDMLAHGIEADDLDAVLEFLVKGFYLVADTSTGTVRYSARVPYTPIRFDLGYQRIKTLERLPDMIGQIRLLVEDGDEADRIAEQLYAASGAPQGPFRLNKHRNGGLGFCGWSHCSVVAPALRHLPGDTLCPDDCADSAIEVDPRPQDD